jgi:hypothetical protein
MILRMDTTQIQRVHGDAPLSMEATMSICVSPVYTAGDDTSEKYRK